MTQLPEQISPFILPQLLTLIRFGIHSNVDNSSIQQTFVDLRSELHEFDELIWFKKLDQKDASASVRLHLSSRGSSPINFSGINKEKRRYTLDYSRK